MILVGLSTRQRAVAVLLLVAGGVGLVCRFLLAAYSVGCDDADIWREHGDFIAAHGVRYAYQHPELESLPFNHPPLMGYLSVWARHVSGTDMVRASFLMKLPGLLAEVLAAFLIWSSRRRQDALTAAWAFAAYGTCATLILVSGFHGNTDCAYAGLSLLSFYLLIEKRAPLLAGLALAAALNVKILPLLMVPPLLSQCRSWREVRRFALGASIAIIPFLPFLVTAPAAVYKAIIAYNSQQLEWGLYAFLSYANGEAIFGGILAKVIGTFVQIGRYLIVAAICALSVLAARRPKRFGYDVGAAAWALFLVLTPGYGVQYSVSVLPLLFAASVRRAALYGVLTAAMLVFIYSANLKLVLPLHGNVQYYPLPKTAVVFGVLAWATLFGYLVRVVSRLAKAGSPPVEAQGDQRPQTENRFSSLSSSAGL